MTKKKITNLDIEKVLREGKDVIFQEEREKHSLTEIHKVIQGTSIKGITTERNKMNRGVRR